MDYKRYIISVGGKRFPSNKGHLMNYFSSSLNPQDAKKIFRKLAVELHPDKGGSQVNFISMQAQYEAYLRGEFSYTTKEAKDVVTSFNEFIQANEFVQAFTDVLVELTGTWVWLSGNTRPYKDTIKEHGFKWSKNKAKWYKAPYELAKKKRKGTNFEKIKNTYGYESHKIKGMAAIA